VLGADVKNLVGLSTTDKRKNELAMVMEQLGVEIDDETDRALDSAKQLIPSNTAVTFSPTYNRP